jgi:hypothetical protein
MEHSQGRNGASIINGAGNDAYRSPSFGDGSKMAV